MMCLPANGSCTDSNSGRLRPMVLADYPCVKGKACTMAMSLDQANLEQCIKYIAVMA